MVGHGKSVLDLDLANQAISLLGDNHSFVFIKDTDHRYISCNDNYAKFLGLSNYTEIVGLTDMVINPQHAELYLSDDQRALKGEIITIDNPAYFNGLGLVSVTGKILPLKNINNHVNGILGTTKLILTIANKPFYQVIKFLNADTIPLIVSKKHYAINGKYGTVRLSKREIECILFLLKSMTTEAIAGCLQLSQRSVESYFVNIKNKLNVKLKHEILDTVILGGLLEQL